ncbi:hypothetical protein CTI16_02590 [Prevotella intermedia]|uniref:Uncharacterized protein n=1 Tax=Prevotella intermedia TaxID=28131 RepID=A0AAJ3RIW3_PREIN|nr:hypothetical protein CTI16_02590 [Prevotella intermedia]
MKKQGNNSDFVKIIYKENGNFDLALRKRRFCNAKEPLLPCKTYAFGTQNNRFYNALIASLLHKRYVYKKSLHNYRLFLVCLSHFYTYFSVVSFCFTVQQKAIYGSLLANRKTVV